MFDSLHWFQSVQEKCIQDKMRVKKQKSLTSKDDEKLQQAMTLTARRLDLHQQEFDLLYYSLSSARIFFQSEKSVQTDEAEKVETWTNCVSTETALIIPSQLARPCPKLVGFGPDRSRRTQTGFRRGSTFTMLLRSRGTPFGGEIRIEKERLSGTP
ncbi:unnamed protein product, partial [Timema podura]|nr:unnamed protein product [Timema podura]